MISYFIDVNKPSYNEKTEPKVIREHFLNFVLLQMYLLQKLFLNNWDYKQKICEAKIMIISVT